MRERAALHKYTISGACLGVGCDAGRCYDRSLSKGENGEHEEQKDKESGGGIAALEGNATDSELKVSL